MACSRQTISVFKQDALIADSLARQQDAPAAWAEAIKLWENLVAISATGSRINRLARKRLDEANRANRVVVREEVRIENESSE